MAIPFLTNVDLNKNQVLNQVLQHIAGNHGSPVEGIFWYDSTGKVLKYYDGSTVITLGEAGGGGDAGTLDGNDSTFYLDRDNHTGTQLAATISDFAAAVAALSIDAETLDGNDSVFFLARANHTGTQALSTITGHDKAAHDALDIDADTLDGINSTAFEQTANKGANNGYASLDGGGKVPVGQIPDTVVGAMDYQGTWNANTNSPSLSNSYAGVKGDYYVVSTAGATSLNSITDWLVGDWVVWNGTTWDKIDNTDKVSSVNGDTGAVVLDTGDINEVADRRYMSDAQETKVDSLPSGPLTSVHNVGDGAASQITLTHNLNTFDVSVEVWLNSGNRPTVYPDVERMTVDTVRLTFSGTAPTTNQYRAKVSKV